MTMQTQEQQNQGEQGQQQQQQNTEGQNNPQQQTQQNQSNEDQKNQQTNQVTISADELARLREEAANAKTADAKVEAVLLRLLPENQRAKAKELIEQVNKDVAAAQSDQDFEERAKIIYAKEQAFENAEFGVKWEDLMKEDSPEAMRAKAAQIKADFYKAQVSGNTPNPANTPVDKGGGGGGSANIPKIEGKGRDAVAKHFGELFKTRHSN